MGRRKVRLTTKVTEGRVKEGKKLYQSSSILKNDLKDKQGD